MASRSVHRTTLYFEVILKPFPYWLRQISKTVKKEGKEKKFCKTKERKFERKFANINNNLAKCMKSKYAQRITIKTKMILIVNFIGIHARRRLEHITSMIQSKSGKKMTRWKYLLYRHTDFQTCYMYFVKHDAMLEHELWAMGWCLWTYQMSGSQVK